MPSGEKIFGDDFRYFGIIISTECKNCPTVLASTHQEDITNVGDKVIPVKEAGCWHLYSS